MKCGAGDDVRYLKNRLPVLSWLGRLGSSLSSAPDAVRLLCIGHSPGWLAEDVAASADAAGGAAPAAPGRRVAASVALRCSFERSSSSLAFLSCTLPITLHQSLPLHADPSGPIMIHKSRRSLMLCRT